MSSYRTWGRPLTLIQHDWQSCDKKSHRDTHSERGRPCNDRDRAWYDIATNEGTLEMAGSHQEPEEARRPHGAVSSSASRRS